MTPRKPSQKVSVRAAVKKTADDTAKPKEALPEPPEEVLDPLSGRVAAKIRNDLLESLFHVAWRGKERADFILGLLDNKKLENLTVLQQIQTAKAFMSVCTEGMGAMSALLKDHKDSNEGGGVDDLVALAQFIKERTGKAEQVLDVKGESEPMGED